MKTLTCIAALGAALMLAAAVHAAPSAIAETCKADVKQFCADVKPGAGKLTACIKSHFKDLSADCQVAFIRVAAVGRDCKSDIKSFCSDAKSKDGGSGVPEGSRRQPQRRLQGRYGQGAGRRQVAFGRASAGQVFAEAVASDVRTVNPSNGEQS